MSTMNETETTCLSCHKFIRIGIPIIIASVLFVVVCIVWYDRYDEKKAQQRQQMNDMNKKKQSEDGHATKNDDDTPSSSSSSNKDDSFDIESPQEVLQSYMSSSIPHNNSKVMTPTTKSIPEINCTKESLVVLPVSASSSSNVVYNLGKLIDRIRVEHLLPTTTMTEDDADEKQRHEDDHDDQSSIESDDTPVVKNNNNQNELSRQNNNNTSPLLLKQQQQQYATTTAFTDIGLIRNHLSIPGSTESESTSSVSSSSSSSESCHDTMHSETNIEELRHITATTSSIALQ